MPQDLTTRLIHHPYRPPAGFESPQVGVFKASTVIFANVSAMRARDWRTRVGYTYGLQGTPTTFTLEERIAELEGARHVVLAPSGLAAIAIADLALLSSGDEVLLPNNVYGPSRELARASLAKFGIAYRLYDPLDAAGFAALLGERTKLVWLEAPGSVTMEFPALTGLIEAARARGVTTAIDNTWGAGVALRPLDLGVDISMQALTKYPSGGGDVLMGSLALRDGALAEKLQLAHMHYGFGIAGNDAELVLRSLPSLALRYAAHDAAARELAAWLATRPEVARVLHPALEGSPGHEHWREHCTAAAGLFSVLFDPRFTTAQVDAFVDALRLFRIGYSWAGPVSLVVPYDIRALRGERAYAGTLVRFAIGLESPADLRADLEQALAVLR